MRQLRLFMFILVVGASSFAQSAKGGIVETPLKPTAGLNGPPSAPSARTVTLGNSTIPLDGLWKFHIGDDMEWAQPGFDDSGWGTMDLTPPKGSYDPHIGSGGFVPGWTARGYKGYHGYVWYRLRVDIENGQSALALKMPDDFDDAYQVYVNGQRIGEFGRFTKQSVTAYNALPRAFSLPANLRSGPATIAIRMWMAAYTPLIDADAGGLHGPPALGHASAIAGLLQMDWDATNRSEYSEFFEMAILLLALLVAFGLFWLDPKEPAYLWLGLTCAVSLAWGVVVLLLNYSTWIDANAGFLVQGAVLTPLIYGLWVLFWAYWFRLAGMRRIHGTVWILVGLLGAGTTMLRAPLYGAVVPVHASGWLTLVNRTLFGLLGLLLAWVAVRGIRKNKAEGWLALPAIALLAASLYGSWLIAFLHVRFIYFLFGISIDLYLITIVLSLLIVTVLLLRRFLHSQREREQWKLEIEQARQVQQMLIPQALPAVPGLRLESEYRPAQQVGGDFFQIIEGSDGSILIVVGDVSGKGLKAAMLVSLIVGTIRTLAKFTRDPMEILDGLNERLCGRMQGHFATCVVLHIAQDGEVTLANAGHLPPYLNGKELPMEGALPLGIVKEVDFSRMDFRLEESDRLIVITDGVLEAMNAKRELFGFARVDAAMQGAKSAAEIAAEAQAFGQEDDITVVRVTRSAKAVEPIAGEPVFAAG